MLQDTSSELVNCCGHQPEEQMVALCRSRYQSLKDRLQVNIDGLTYMCISCMAPVNGFWGLLNASLMHLTNHNTRCRAAHTLEV